jgi:periplasmic protein TonB
MALTDPASTDLNYLSGDKFGFGIFVAAAAHAVIVFGLTFDWSGKPQPAPEIDVTIVTHQTESTPDEADFVAQANQAASGTEERVLAPTTDQLSAFVGADNGEFSPYEATAGDSNAQSQNSLAQDQSEQPIPEAEQVGDAESDAELNMEASALLARLDVLKQELARRPRIGTLTSVSARAREDAAYQVMLQERITLVGKSMIPAQEIEQGMTGSARLVLSLLPEGRIESIEISESSGIQFLDKSAVEIARAAGPFDPFPPELRAKYDKIYFIRTFEFSLSGQLSIF